MPVKFIFSPEHTEKSLPQRFERKYFIVAGEIGLAYGILRQICLPAAEYPSEQINSLYFDTIDLDQHERSLAGDFAKDKVRIRWYGKTEELSGLQTVFVELKSRMGFASTKQRYKMQVPADTLQSGNIIKGIIPSSRLVDILSGFGYFPAGKFFPVIRISYWRYRFSEIITGQRLSLDSHIRSTLIMPSYGYGERELGLHGAVIEVKGQNMAIPVSLKRMRILHTDWTRFSKYSACIEAHLDAPGSVGRFSPTGRNVRF